MFFLFKEIKSSIQKERRRRIR